MKIENSPYNYEDFGIIDDVINSDRIVYSYKSTAKRVENKEKRKEIKERLVSGRKTIFARCKNLDIEDIKNTLPEEDQEHIIFDFVCEIIKIVRFTYIKSDTNNIWNGV
ncbi:hypothetical protein ES705_41417 [subsurface metagenome]